MGRKFISGAVNHCYQRTLNGEVIFYCVSDYLVCYTHISVASRRHPVKVLSQVLMPDHLHGSYIAESEKHLRSFVQDYTSHFVRVHNVTCHWNAPLFQAFGSAQKVRSKDIRSNLIYLGNNGPERHLSEKAEDYRWSFLAYAHHPHPFSKKLRLDYVSRPLRRAIQEVRAFRKAEKPLTYAALQRMTRPLNRAEKQQLADYIIVIYQYIDYEAASAYFESWDAMLSAMHDTKGSEYELKEEFTGWDDKVYSQMASILIRKYKLADIHDCFLWSDQEKLRAFTVLKAGTAASERQIAKFLRIWNWRLTY